MHFGERVICEASDRMTIVLWQVCGSKCRDQVMFETDLHVEWKQSYHQAFITGMDICLLKPFVVTCSKDKSVRVWNFEERSCELLKFFPSEALSVSIHPNGPLNCSLVFNLNSTMSDYYVIGDC